ncbi:probable sodium/potassium/calcium exchanger CG1090 [Parasteatoda tepidariorum]|uniref:probable sodium/potassium/calcium exchanger CG1090 n=1 Tax=Parasteatoda tepidariorum TaxID=114398 RepID=UPI00077FC713|nr:probable sodium/potassium/calcium exchanger CG1090 isoform X2 [Parasteatoda tepidariorum]XP_015906652.1 probable sodium/potassium/calcium exchanger CG1090 isoform X2 [Parasteatoda tepidariorum]XP_015906653.1 probable sodium/potassium/calcium exchanger CG1090 isoform X2 [Parasteatoda tepidariorum]XP_042900821.1 probable sodium/potassium/calcium exchanger CG1090 isoform X2 [Parasteatoda tepidariorum]
MAKLRREIIACLISLYTGFCLVFYAYSTVSFSPPDGSLSIDKSDQNSISSIFNRKLLSFYDFTESLSENENCTKPDIEQFPRPLIDYPTRRNGGLAVHIFVSLYMFLGLAIICDEYFVPSLEKMCKSLNMQSDVAGATFMAAGSSAPELATAVIAVFVAKDDIGIGTVVGSAVFNIAFVIGICGLFAGKAIHLNCWPMFRDCVFYLISILALLFVLLDESVNWLESAIFLVLYAVYIIFMFFNERFERWVKSIKCLSRLNCRIPEPINGVSYHALPDLTQAGFLDNCDKTSNSELTSVESPQPLTEEAEEENSVFSPPEGGFRKSFWLLSIPILIVCYFTIPDCRRKRWEKWFFVTFLASCVWIGALSYILVWMITIIGFTLNIKDTIMGLSFLAAGASIPDAISSLLVVRDGLGDMAVSNAVGSNVFDILLCLGLPWFIQTALVEPGSHVLVRSRGLTYSTLTLLLTIVFLLLATHLNKWVLDRKYGIILLIWYAIFMMIAIFYESSLFGSDILPMCPSDF